jgi:Mor family transcriptional regulator
MFVSLVLYLIILYYRYMTTKDDFTTFDTFTLGKCSAPGCRGPLACIGRCMLFWDLAYAPEANKQKAIEWLCEHPLTSEGSSMLNGTPQYGGGPVWKIVGTYTMQYPLTGAFAVEYKDGNRRNLVPDNLIIYPNADVRKSVHRSARYQAERNAAKGWRCVFCGSFEADPETQNLGGRVPYGTGRHAHQKCRSAYQKDYNERRLANIRLQHQELQKKNLTPEFSSTERRNKMILEEAKSGATLKDLCIRYNLSPFTIMAIARPEPPDKDMQELIDNPVTLALSEDQQILNDYNKNFTDAQLAAKYNYSINAVQKIRRRASRDAGLTYKAGRPLAGDQSKHLRNKEIFKDSQAGLSVKELTEMYDLSDARIRTILRIYAHKQ